MTPDQKRELALQRKREWYAAHRDECKAKAIARYYEHQDEIKTRNRERARAQKAKIETLQKEITVLKNRVVTLDP